MEQRARFRRATTIVRGLCIAVAGCGIYLLTKEIIGLPKEMRAYSSASGLCFQLIFDLLILIIGFWLMRAALLGWQHRTAAAVRGLCLTSIVAAWVCGMHFIIRPHLTAAQQLPPGITWNDLGVVAMALLATTVYFALSRLLMSQLGLKDERNLNGTFRSNGVQ
jgi:hypothetical protein